jgi:ubiquinone biosynthesis protein
MVFEHGFFHADPIRATSSSSPTGGSGLIDFGMVGTVSQRTREELGRALVAIAGRDDDGLVDAFLELGLARKRVDRRRLRDDLAALLDRHSGATVAELKVGR